MDCEKHTKEFNGDHIVMKKWFQNVNIFKGKNIAL